MNKVRLGLNAGCSLLLVSGFALSLSLKPSHYVMRWLAEEPASLEIPPVAFAAIDVIALLILGPLTLGALLYIFKNGVGRTFAQIWSFWLAGLKFGIVCLLLFLPFVILDQMIKYSKGTDAILPGSPVARLVFLALLCILAPFWSLLLIRHLPSALLRGTLFERFNLENFDPGSL